MKILMVTKEYTFDSAHRLVNGYKGKCAHIHGHHWRLKITAKLNSHSNLNEFGFVKDYGDFKPLKVWIDEVLDHASLVSIKDKTWLKFLVKEKQRHFVFSDNPTSEAIAEYILSRANVLLRDSRVTISKIELFETPTSCATVFDV